MSALWQESKTQRDASVELQRRLSFPFACISFALLAMPIGARPRRGGRAAGFMITLVADYGLLPDVYDWRGPCPPGIGSDLDGHLVGERDHGRIGAVSVAEAGAHARQQPHRGHFRFRRGMARLENFFPGRPFHFRTRKRRVHQRQNFQSKKSALRASATPGRLSAADASSTTSYC